MEWEARSVTDGDRAGTVEAVAERGVAAADLGDLAFDQLVAEDRDDPRQRSDPARTFGPNRGRAPAHRLRPGEVADDRDDRPGEHFVGRAARPFDDREIRPAAVLEPVLAEPGLAQEALERLRRRADLGPLDLLAHRLGGLRQVARDQREAARGRQDGDVAVRHPRRGHVLAEQFFQIAPRPRLHPRGDFLTA
jgi:hypothetical protein